MRYTKPYQTINQQIGILKSRGLSIEAKIAELHENKRSLERLLVNVRREHAATKDVTRKNSVGRVLIENAILEALQVAGKPLTGTQLYKIARRTEFELKDTTFRSYLHRMKKRGLIEKKPGNSWQWQLAQATAIEQKTS